MEVSRGPGSGKWVHNDLDCLNDVVKRRGIDVKIL